MNHSKTYENENPGPSRPSTNAMHLPDCSSKQTRESARELGVNFSAKHLTYYLEEGGGGG
jgi:hypothetical protein